MLKLVIGNRNYSSWSLRAWLYLTEAGVPFEEVYIPLFTNEWHQRIAQYSPSGRVPALADGDVRVWDSWAIIEYVRATKPVRFGWPEPAAAHAMALSVSAEMHAGFLAVRAQLPMNIRAHMPGRWSQLDDVTRKEVDRIRAIWSQALDASGGPFLFGELSIADIMYAPVTARFRTYGIDVNDAGARYIESVQALEGMKRWVDMARREQQHLDFIDDLASETPLHPG